MTGVDKDTGVTLVWLYCNIHDDAVNLWLTEDSDILSVCYDRKETCSASSEGCHYSIIGIQAFSLGSDGKIGETVFDTTHRFKFARRGGGFEHQFLSQIPVEDPKPIHHMPRDAWQQWRYL